MRMQSTGRSGAFLKPYLYCQRNKSRRSEITLSGLTQRVVLRASPANQSYTSPVLSLFKLTYHTLMETVSREHAWHQKRAVQCCFYCFFALALLIMAVHDFQPPPCHIGFSLFTGSLDYPCFNLQVPNLGTSFSLVSLSLISTASSSLAPGLSPVALAPHRGREMHQKLRKTKKSQCVEHYQSLPAIPHRTFQSSNIQKQTINTKQNPTQLT